MPPAPPSEPPLSSRDAAVRLIAALRHAGHVAYLAGGCVRDRLLGLTPTDHDVATDAPPDAVRKLWRRSRFVGEAFGVVLARVAGHDVEVATFRKESGYDDHRRPTNVEFTDAREDAIRRDFTINGLFEDPAPAPAPGNAPASGSGVTPSRRDEYAGAMTRSLDDGSVVIDYVGGLADLDAGVVRAIGEASERFDEDYLRMLRAVRFAARLGFALDDATARAIKPLARYLGSISRERIGDETRKMLAGPRPATAATMCQALKLDGPTLNEDHADPPLPTLRAIETAGGHAPLAVAIAAWIVDRHAPGPSPGSASGASTSDDTAALAAFAEDAADRVVRKWRDALCLSNAERDDLARLFLAIPPAARWADLDKAKRKRALAMPGWPNARSLLLAAGAAELVATIDRDAAPLIEEGIAPEPFVAGDDLLALGLEPGPAFKKLLDDAYDAQLALEVTTRDAALDRLRAAAAKA